MICRKKNWIAREIYIKLEMWELLQMQSLPLEAKIVKSQQRIREWYNHWDGDVYISVSGKDSCVVYDLVKKMYPNVPVVFCDTGLEYPEIVSHVKTLENVTVLRPKYTFKEIIDKYGYPVISKEQSQYIDDYRRAKSDKWKQRLLNGDEKGHFKISNKWKYLVKAPFKISEECCRYLKKIPFNNYAKETNRKPFLGTLASDSMARRKHYMSSGGCNVYDQKIPKSSPIGFWMLQDVLSYLKNYNVSYSSIYGDIVEDKNGLLKTTGVENTGCMFCMFGVHMEKTPNRFQKMKQTHPKHWDYCINKLNLRQVLDYIYVPYE
jgi:3'-phosphoadenosine 5'-phosphosulfate sulfotransferase (PAPS reductase)/FAD synthetase